MVLGRSSLVIPSLILFLAECQSAPKPVAAPLPPPATEEQATNHTKMVARRRERRDGVMGRIANGRPSGACVTDCSARPMRCRPTPFVSRPDERYTVLPTRAAFAAFFTHGKSTRR